MVICVCIQSLQGRGPNVTDSNGELERHLATLSQSIQQGQSIPRGEITAAIGRVLQHWVSEGARYHQSPDGGCADALQPFEETLALGTYQDSESQSSAPDATQGGGGEQYEVA